MNQQTLKNRYTFEGRGLHTGKYAHLTLMPAPADYGIRFVRTDRDVEIPAIASKVTRTDRSTTISEGEVSVITIEHLMSALTGLGVDNARIEIDNEEVPILDGSAERYVRAIAPDGLLEQDAERRYVEFTEEFEVHDEQTGSWVRVTPQGYLSNIKLHFPNECGRHKLLDLIGDMRLAGGFPKAKITAYKPGHTINSLASRMALSKIK